MNEVKQCTRCRDTLPETSEFFALNKRSGKLRKWCSVCIGEYEVQNPSRIGVVAASYQREYYAANKEKCLGYNQNWRAANRKGVLASARRRKARNRNAEGRLTAADIKRQYQAQRGKCHWCSIKVGKNYHVDHIVPLARGGSNWPENIVIACPSCNQSKGSKLPHEWPQGGRLL